MTLQHESYGVDVNQLGGQQQDILANSPVVPAVNGAHKSFPMRCSKKYSYVYVSHIKFVSRIQVVPARVTGKRVQRFTSRPSSVRYNEQRPA